VACTNSQCSVLPGLSLYWRFDETTGNVALDSSGNGWQGVYMGDSGTPTPSTDLPPIRYTNTRSRLFSKSNEQAVRLPNFSGTLRPAFKLTLAAWYKSTGVDGDGSEVISGGNAYILRLGPSQIETSKAVSGGFFDCRATVAGYLDGGWHHLAVVFGDSNVTIYFDGTARATCNSTAAISYSGAGSDLWVGRHGDGQEIYDFDGNIDEVRVYGRALSAAEIQILAGGGS
jgi:hypothetical protein